MTHFAHKYSRVIYHTSVEPLYPAEKTHQNVRIVGCLGLLEDVFQKFVNRFYHAFWLLEVQAVGHDVSQTEVHWDLSWPQNQVQLVFQALSKVPDNNSVVSILTEFGDILIDKCFFRDLLAQAPLNRVFNFQNELCNTMKSKNLPWLQEVSVLLIVVKMFSGIINDSV